MRDIFEAFEKAKYVSFTSFINLTKDIEIQNLGKKSDTGRGEYYEFKVIYKEE